MSLLCVLVEFPHGLLNLCTGIFGAAFGFLVYDHLGSFMEMLTLLYSSINFVLYCTMLNVIHMMEISEITRNF